MAARAAASSNQILREIGLEVVLTVRVCFSAQTRQERATSAREGVFRSIVNYMGDAFYFDPVLLKAYDEVLPEIDRALGESP